MSKLYKSMKAILVLFAAIAFAIAPFLSPEFGGFDPNRYPNPQINPPVQPAGWAFSIWGLIYLGLVVHAVAGFWKYRHDAIWEQGRLSLFVSLAVGAFWLPVALVSPVWATVMIWVMLLAALAAVSGSRDGQPHWLAVWPLALYAGWLTAASFVSIGLMLAGYAITSEFSAAIIALVLAFAFAAVFAIRFKLLPYGAAVAWGFAGIAAANSGESMVLTVASGLAALGVLGLSVGRPARG